MLDLRHESHLILRNELKWDFGVPVSNPFGWYQNAKCTFKIEAAGVSLLDKLNKGNCRYGESLKIYAIIQ